MITVYDVPDVRAKRKEFGITQLKMAHILKVSLSTYQKYEKEFDMPISKVKKCTEYLQALQKIENNIGV